jgi:hypothetical protein
MSGELEVIWKESAVAVSKYILAFSWRGQSKPRKKKTFRIGGVVAEIRTEHLPNTVWSVTGIPFCLVGGTYSNHSRLRVKLRRERKVFSIAEKHTKGRVDKQKTKREIKLFGMFSLIERRDILFCARMNRFILSQCVNRISKAPRGRLEITGFCTGT